MGLSQTHPPHDLTTKHAPQNWLVGSVGVSAEAGSSTEKSSVALTGSLFRNQEHPYTEALMSTIPIPNPELRRQRVILKGDVPSPVNPPSGCRFHPRCQLRLAKGSPAICAETIPPLIDLGSEHLCACHFRQPAAADP